MPRYEKVGKTKSQFFEILIISDDAVMTAEGERAGSDGEWSVSRTSPRTWFPPATSQAFVDEKVASLLAKKYKLIGDELLVIKPAPKTPEQIETAKRIVEYIALIQASGKVLWTGKKPENADQFVEIFIEPHPVADRGFNVLTRKGKIGSKGTIDKDNYAHRKLALRVAAIRLSSAGSDGFGP